MNWLEHMNILIMTRTAIRAPWLVSYQQSSNGHKATKKMAIRMANAMDKADRLWSAKQ